MDLNGDRRDLQAVAGNDVLWTGGDGADEIAQRLEHDPVTGPTVWIGDLHASVGGHRAVLKQVERFR